MKSRQEIKEEKGGEFPDFPDIAAMCYASCITAALHIILKMAEHPALFLWQVVQNSSIIHYIVSTCHCRNAEYTCSTVTALRIRLVIFYVYFIINKSNEKPKLATVIMNKLRKLIISRNLSLIDFLILTIDCI